MLLMVSRMLAAALIQPMTVSTVATVPIDTVRRLSSLCRSSIGMHMSNLGTLNPRVRISSSLISSSRFSA